MAWLQAQLGEAVPLEAPGSPTVPGVCRCLSFAQLIRKKPPETAAILALLFWNRPSAAPPKWFSHALFRNAIAATAA